MTSILDDDAYQIYMAVRAVTQVLRTQDTGRWKALGLTTQQLDVLLILVDLGGAAIRDITWRMGLSHSTVSGIVDRLELRGLVERWPDPKDHRSMQVDLTRRARKLLSENVLLPVYAPIVTALAGASREQRDTIVAGVTTLGKLLEHQRLRDLRQRYYERKAAAERPPTKDVSPGRRGGRPAGFDVRGKNQPHRKR